MTAESVAPTQNPADLRVLGRTRNVMPACLACGGYYIDRVAARLSVGAVINGEVYHSDGYDWRMLFVCTSCGFVASGAAVTS